MGEESQNQENTQENGNENNDSNEEEISDDSDIENPVSNGEPQDDHQDQTDEVESSEEAEPQPETVPEPILPDINFYLTDYDVRKFDFTLNWQDRNSVAQNWELQYKLAPSFDWVDLANSSSLTANSFDFIAEYDDLTYYFRIRAQYDSNNFSDWVELPVDISSKPVAINEVAWMGTEASTNDEWIELVNKTNQEIDLSGWTIRSQENPPRISISLNGKIAPNGYYLLERTNDDPVPGIVADQIYTGALNNSSGPGDYGQQLTLNNEGNNEIDKIHTAYAGDNETKQTAERVSIWALGDEKTNWETSQSSPGTPKFQNSQADLYFFMSSIGNYQTPKNVILLKDRGPYIANSAVSVYPQSNLIIEPGTVLKFDYYGSLNIFGNLIAKGTAEEKIIFTSLKDDENDGDTNGDGDATTAQKGDWMNVVFSENSGGEMDYAEFRYGVNIWTKNGVNNWSKSNVYIEKANVKISNSVFENSGGDALVIFNDPEATSPDIQLLGNEFRNNGGRGVAIAYANDLEIANNIFTDNGEAGIWFGTPGGWMTDLGNINISDNIFTNNKAPMEINKFADFSISGNSMSSNANNGILVYGGGITEAKDSVTVSSDMPFVFIDSGTVDEGETLNLSPGTVFKFSQTAFGIYGTLNAIGTPDQPIVFTALEDDNYGGDTNNDGSVSVPRAGAWYWMQFVSGENSILDNVIVKYAGRIGYSMGGPPSGGSGIAVESGVGNFTLKNSTSADSVTGATIFSDGVIIENTVFSNNDQTGLSISANNATVINVTFENNQKAFQSSSAYMATILLSNLIFNSNAYNYWPEDLIVQP